MQLPDGALLAEMRDDRICFQFRDVCRIYDIRIVGRDRRFLAQLGELTLVWTADRGLVVLTPLNTPYRITPEELDSVLGLA